MQAKREFILAILAPSLVFLSGFLTFILHHDYGVFSREVILAMILIGLAGMLLGIPLALAGPTRLRAFGFAILLFIFFDVQFDLINTIHHYLANGSSVLQKYAVLIVTLFIAQIIILGLHRHIASIITTIFAVTILTTIILPIPKVSYGAQPVDAIKTPDSDIPPIIHLVLDGHIGVEGIPLDIEGGVELKDKIKLFYKRWGFRLYGRAYSKYFMTFNSLSNLLNGEASRIDAGLSQAIEQSGKIGWKPAINSYFRQFAASGYRIRVYQSDYFDFCQDTDSIVEYCYRYSSSSPQLIKELNLPVTEKTELIIGSYIGTSTVYKELQSYYNQAHALLPDTGILSIIPSWKQKNYAFSSLGVPAVFTRLEKDLSQNPQGRLFLAHLMLPHAPYIWDSECRIRNNSDTWLNRRLDHEHWLTLSNPEYRKSAYKVYFQQTHCLLSLLDNLLETIEQEVLSEGTTVIIHGDHGSRITIADPLYPMIGHTTERDYIDAFSTLFAIRSSKIEQGYDEHTRAIQNLFAELVLEAPPPSTDDDVLLQTDRIIMRKPMESVAMPSF